MENEELKKEQANKESRSKEYRINRIKVITNYILIGLLVLLLVYSIIEIQNFKLLGTDVCKICMEKTGAICSKIALP